MKLASLKEGGRDGTLIVVDKDIKRAVRATGIAATLQKALDDWASAAPRLAELAERLRDDKAVGSFELDTRALAAPLPRAYQWADGSAYLSHVERVRQARNAPLPENFLTDPLMYQGGSDDLRGPTDEILSPAEEFGIDFEAEVAVVTDDVPMGASPQQAAGAILLLMLVNDVSLRELVAPELARGFGFLQSKAATAFSPVAVTPDELGAAWDGARVSLPLLVHRNGRPVGKANAGADLAFDFPRLIAHLCRTRGIRAGSIVGSGTVSNRDPASGYSCIAEQRAVEVIGGGAPVTPYLSFGDTVRIEMFDAAGPEHGQSIFGAIDQKVAPA